MAVSRALSLHLVAVLCILAAAAPLSAASKGKKHAATALALPDVALRHVLLVEPTMHLHLLGNVSDLPDRLKRTFLDAGHRRAAAQLLRWMRAAGMGNTWIDAVGNVRGRTAAADPVAPAMFVGSHYDSVIDGGIYDGAMGIIVGIAATKALVLDAGLKSGVISRERLISAVETLTAKLQGGAPEATLYVQELLTPKSAFPALRQPIEVVGFSDEEGVRFQSTFLGSRALAGTLVASGMLQTTDAQGVSLAGALQAAGMEGTEAAVAAAAVDPNGAAGYVEVHLEQGPLLEVSRRVLGVVRGIAGQTRLLIKLKGAQGHAGTVPMRLRHDPLAAAAEIISQIDNICVKMAIAEDSLVCTVGALTLWPGASNVIPGAANFTVDVRCQTDDLRGGVVAAVQAMMREVCSKRGVTCSAEIRHEMGAVYCDEKLMGRLASAVEHSVRDIVPRLELEKAGEADEGGCIASEKRGDKTCQADLNVPTIKTMRTEGGEEIAVLASGAGHDAMAVSEVAPIGMLFVRCRAGVSHSPEESVAPTDVARGTAALVQFLKEWEERGE